MIQEAVRGGVLGDHSVGVVEDGRSYGLKLDRRQDAEDCGHHFVDGVRAVVRMLVAAAVVQAGEVVDPRKDLHTRSRRFRQGLAFGEKGPEAPHAGEPRP